MRVPFTLRSIIPSEFSLLINFDREHLQKAMELEEFVIQDWLV